MSNKPTKPWVIIPTYNERDNVTPLIKEIFSLPIPNLHLLFVDDSSPDKTADLIKQQQNHLPRLHLLLRPKKDGLGRAYIEGFQYAINHGASHLIQMDADFSHNPQDIPRLLNASARGVDVVIGSRYKNGISVINWPLRRLLISMTGNIYATFITGLPFKDVTGGFRCWRSEILNKINLPSIKANGYAFQIITAYLAWKKGATITEIPITFTERREGQSKMSRAIVREAIWIVWRVRLTGK